MKTKNSDYVKDQPEKERKNHTETEKTIEDQIDQFVKTLVNTYFKLENEKSNKYEE